MIIHSESNKEWTNQKGREYRLLSWREYWEEDFRSNYKF